MSVDISCTADLLLRWYDAHARILPWRSPPGAPLPDPYRVWLSEIMLQQTTVAAVKPYYAHFTALWPTVADLAAADPAAIRAAWAGLGYYSRARNLIACAQLLAADGFPADEAGLRSLPGIGPYTASAIAAIAFGQHAVVVDGNVERVVARLFAVDDPLPQAKPALRRLAGLLTPDRRPGDYAQAMMDLGATICTPRHPRCDQCPLSGVCTAFARGDPAGFPRRTAKPAKPERAATAWWIERHGEVLLVRRPETGLFGGMMALPSTLASPAEAPAAADGDASAPQPTPVSGGATIGVVTHVFTHFRLSMTVVRAALDPGCVLPPDAQWWPVSKLAGAGLPTLFAKAAARAMRESE